MRIGSQLLPLSIVLAACRPSPPPSETPDDAPPHATPLPGKQLPTPPVEPTLAEVPMAATIPATPFPADALVIEWPDEQPDITLFADERAQLREAIATKLRTKDRPVASIEELAKLEDLAALGVLDLEGGQRCRAPLSRGEVFDRYFRKHTIAEPLASCGAGCRLDVFTHVEGKSRGGWVREGVRKPEDPRSWIAAAAKLAMSGESVGFGSGHGTGKDLDIQFRRVSSVGPWKGELALSIFDPLDAELVACADRDPAVFVAHVLRGAVAPDGTVERCEHELERPAPRPGVAPAECLCGVLRKLKLPRGAKGRRFRADVHDRGAKGSASPKLELVAQQEGIDPWIQRFVQAGVLERCQVEHPVTESFTATLGIPLAPDGEVGTITAVGAGRQPASKAFVECMVAGLAKVALPCAPPGLPELRVGLTVEAGG